MWEQRLLKKRFSSLLLGPTRMSEWLLAFKPADELSPRLFLLLTEVQTVLFKAETFRCRNVTLLGAASVDTDGFTTVAGEVGIAKSGSAWGKVTASPLSAIPVLVSDTIMFCQLAISKSIANPGWGGPQ